jgi:hypothetical protein
VRCDAAQFECDGQCIVATALSAWMAEPVKVA